MNATFTRLMWKEYRAQRMLWIVLLLGWLGLHLIFIFNEQSVLDAAPVIVMIPVCFLVAAATIAFAGEEDDKTANLLRMLPCRTLSLMSAKVTTIVVGCMTLCLAMLVLSAALEFILRVVVLILRDSGFQPFGLQIRLAGLSDIKAISWQDGEGLYVPAFLAMVFASGMFASLNARSIFSAVGATVVVVLGIMITAFSITSDVHQYQLGIIAPWIAGVAAVLMVISTVFLSRPWHLGRLPRRWNMSETAGNFSARRIPSFAWFWHGWLRRIVAQPLTLRRGMRILTWRECRSAVPFAATWLTFGTLICAGRYNSTSGYPWPFLFLFVFIHECGQRTMREDQRSGCVLLLANMGIHPLQIWMSKMFSWLLVLFLVGFAVIALDAVVPSARGVIESSQSFGTRILNIIDSLRVPEFGRSFGRHDTPSTPADHWLQTGVCLAAVLGLFSLGQLTACWIQRQIIAFAASFVVTIAAAYLFLNVIMKDWPVWIALVPIPFCFLLATATTARQWIDRSVTWRLRIRQTLWLVLPCVGFPLLGLLAWRCQPLFALASLMELDPGNAVHGVYNLQNPAGAPEIAQLSALAKSPWSEWDRLDSTAETKCWLEFAAAIEKSPLQHTMIGQSGYVGENVLEDQRPRLLSHFQFLETEPAIIRELLKPFDAVLAEKSRFPAIPVMWTAPWSNTPAVALSVALLEDARHREGNGDIAGAVQQIVRAIHVNRSLAMQTSSWTNWLVCLDAERVALGRLRLLLGSADLSSVDLNALLEELKSALVMTQRDGKNVVQLQDPQLMLQRRTLFWSTAIFTDKAFFDKLRKLPDDQRGFESQNALALMETEIHEHRAFESARAIYTMWLSEALLVAKYRSMTIDGRVCFAGDAPTQRFFQQLQRFMATSNLADLNVDLLVAESGHIANNVFIQHVDTIASERATLLTIMLQQYRLVHGTFPDSLVSLLDLPNGDPLSTIIQTDPWTGGPFLYAATGHKSPLKLHLGRTSPRTTPAQPLLYSTGGFGLSLQSYVATLSMSEPTEMYKLPPNVIVFLGLSDNVDWRIGQIATSVTVFPVPAADPPEPAIH